MDLLTDRRLAHSSLLAALAALVIATPLQAATKVWTGAVDRDWATGGNWVGGVPGASDDVIITNAANDVLLSSDTAALTSLTISNNTLVCTNWTTTINATTVTVQDGGVIGLPGAFQDTQMSNRVHIACTDLTVEQGGAINADDGGYREHDGPGAGSTSINYYQPGGSYGGRGGAGARWRGGSTFGSTYGPASAPTAPGSGAGGYSSGTHYLLGGHGGGAVRIDASGTVVVNGIISADGSAGLNEFNAGGSGGAVYITCSTFGGASSGLIKAQGGHAFRDYDAGGAGGGGRIALDYSSLGVPADVRFSASPGTNDFGRLDTDHRWYYTARMGSLWLPDTQLLSATLDGNQFTDCRIMGPTSWSPASLTVSNCAVTFGEDGFVLNVAGDIQVETNGVLGIGHDFDGTNFTVNCAGSIVVTNGGALWVYAAPTNNLAVGHGALVRVTNDIIVGPSSWIYPVSHEENGSSPRFVMDNLVVAAGGGINASSKGYGSDLGPGATQGSTLYNDGGSHGGIGGAAPDQATGYFGTSPGDRGAFKYGSESVPTTPGSGGGQHLGHLLGGGIGGGAIRIEASGAVTIEGSVSSDGGDALNPYGGGGAGGSVYLKCNTFGGTSSGIVRAAGGEIYTTGDRTGAGAGGRIAVDYNSLAATHAVRFNASPGYRERTILYYDEITQFHFRAQEGTLWVASTDILPEVFDGSQFTDVRIFGPTVWQPNSLLITNSKIILSEANWQVYVTNDVVVGNGAWFGIGDKWDGSNTTLSVGGNLVVTNGGGLHVYGGRTDVSGLPYGARVAVTNDILIAPGSWIYPYSHWNYGDSPKFTAGGDLFIASGGGFDASSRGYGHQSGPGKPPVHTTSAGGGGGYGGRGGAGAYNKAPIEGGYPYGAVHQPTAPGSGGNAYNSHGEMGGAGGGLVWVEVDGTATVNGTINANGYDAIKILAGGGSGGGVYLVCNTFGGSGGTITADGGGGIPTGIHISGGGGGGRIALDYNVLSGTHDVSFSAAPAGYSWAFFDVTNRWQLIPRVGTLSLPDAGLLSDTLASDRFAGAVSLYFQDITSWDVDQLTVSNAWVAFGQDDFSVFVTNDLVVSTGGAIGLGHYHDGSNYTLAVGGDLILTNGGDMHLFGGLTNAMGEGDVSAVVTVTNDLLVGAGSWVYPSSHDLQGGAPVLRVRDIEIASGGGINADGKGYRGKTGPGAGTTSSSSVNGPSGGGYGGKGGDGGTTPGGATYGLTNGPALPGSGSGTHGGYLAFRGGAGGGPVRIEARRNAMLDGTISADGGRGPYLDTIWSPGGSGGGIYIVASNFSGGVSAVLKAEGGDRYHVNSGSGGGGRVTVWNNVPYVDRTNHLAGGTVSNLVISEVFANYFGDISALGGEGTSETGTTFYLRSQAGNSFEMQVNGSPALYDSPTTPGYAGYGTHVDIPANTWITNTVTSPTDESAGQRWIMLNHDVKTHAGLDVTNAISTQAVFQLTTNITLTWFWTNQYSLALTYGLNGTVNSNVVNGWYTNHATVANITATPDGGYIFDGWTGDFPAGQGAANPLSVTMDQARNIGATFSLAVIRTNHWVGTGSWTNPANWSESEIPKIIDHVVVESGTLTADSSQYMETLIVSNGATLTFTNWNTKLYVSSDIDVYSNGLITCAGPTRSTESNRVHLVCSNLTVHAGGRIDVTDKGYDAWQGPGAGGFSTVLYQRGGSYGGRGGAGNRFIGDVTNGLPHYGSITVPLSPGSGGGSYKSNANTYETEPRRVSAGGGGGAICVDASGRIRVDGSILADGGDSVENFAAGGSGGGIYLVCDTFGGNDGWIAARGGDAFDTATSGGGGGGRIAIDYNALATPRNVHISTAPASVDWGGANHLEQWIHAARAGTLWLPDTALLASPIVDTLFDQCNIVVGGVSTWAPADLAITNASLTFAENGFKLNVVNDLLVGPGGSLGIGAYYDAGTDFELTAGGNVSLVGGDLHVYAGSTNGTVGDAGALVNITGDLTVGAGSTLYAVSHTNNGGTPRIVADNITVATGGKVEASARGYAMRAGPGTGIYDYFSGGAAYGGRGGVGDRAARGGSTYGSVHTPVDPGSGGMTHTGHRLAGGAGGGCIRLEAADTLTVNGTVKADGADMLMPFGAPGSGGGIYLKCNTFGGSSGLVQAAGGRSTSTNASGAAGGGRIAVEYNALAGTPSVAFSAAAGTGGWHTAENELDHRWQHRAQEGTLCLPDTSLLSANLTEAHFAGPVRLYFSAASAWSPVFLNVSNCSVNLADDGFELDVAGELKVDAGAVFGVGDDDQGQDYRLSCGSLVLTNGGAFYAMAGLTSGVSSAYGTVVTVEQQVVVGPTSWLYPVAHNTEGTTVLLDAGGLNIASNAGINANARGYYSRLGPGAGLLITRPSGGGGFGGRGGDPDAFPPSYLTPGAGGPTYGSSNAPVQPGSAGTTYNGNGYQARGGSGGGAVRLNVRGAVRLNGAIQADGGKGLHQPAFEGSGSGGSIYLTCNTFLSSAGSALYARGGNGVDNIVGPGGGGRIAVWENVSESQRNIYLLGGSVPKLTDTNSLASVFAGTLSVTNGAGYIDPTNPPEVGTVRYFKIPLPAGTLIWFR